MYIYVYIYMYVCVCIYTYIYKHRAVRRWKNKSARLRRIRHGPIRWLSMISVSTFSGIGLYGSVCVVCVSFVSVCVCARVECGCEFRFEGACFNACMCVCVHACVHACVPACTRASFLCGACLWWYLHD